MLVSAASDLLLSLTHLMNTRAQHLCIQHCSASQACSLPCTLLREGALFCLLASMDLTLLGDLGGPPEGRFWVSSSAWNSDSVLSDFHCDEQMTPLLLFRLAEQDLLSSLS